MKILWIVLILAILNLLWLRHENNDLVRSYAAANHTASKQKIKIDTLEDQLRVVDQLASSNESAQAALREQLAKANAQANRREQMITILANQNETFRQWYNVPLPDVVHRLHTRPACTSAGDCNQPMPEVEPLPDAGK